MNVQDGKPTLRIEVICALDRWILGCQLGLPGVMNDLNILDFSNHFSKVLSGTFPPVLPSFTIGGQVLYWFYYLTDGMYLPWKVFMKTLSMPTSREKNLFCKLHERVC